MTLTRIFGDHRQILRKLFAKTEADEAQKPDELLKTHCKDSWQDCNFFTNQALRNEKGAQISAKDSR